MIWVVLIFAALVGVALIVTDVLHQRSRTHNKRLAKQNFDLRMVIHNIEVLAKAQIATGDTDLQAIAQVIEDVNFAMPTTHQKELYS